MIRDTETDAEIAVITLEMEREINLAKARRKLLGKFVYIGYLDETWGKPIPIKVFPWDHEKMYTDLKSPYYIKQNVLFGVVTEVDYHHRFLLGKGKEPSWKILTAMVLGPENRHFLVEVDMLDVWTPKIGEKLLKQGHPNSQ